MARHRKTAKQPVVAIYTRVSTDEQAASGLGLADQLDRCRAYVTAMRLDDGAEVREFTDAGVSAKSLDRPALAELLGLVERKLVRAVVVLKTDRIARKTLDLLTLVEVFDRHRVTFVSVREQLDTGSSTGRMVLTILGATAQAEREAIAERTRSAVRAKLRQGLVHGWVPLGYRAAAGRLVEDVEEQATVATILDLHNRGAPLRAIAAILTFEGRRTKRGGSWGPQNIANVVRRYAASDGQTRAAGL